VIYTIADFVVRLYIKSLDVFVILYDDTDNIIINIYSSNAKLVLYYYYLKQRATHIHSYFYDTDMSPVYHHNKEQEEAGYQNLIPIAWAILVMGLSLAAVILAYIWFGHIGPTFSSDILQKQQRELRQQYGLPYEPDITDPKILQTPPSERGLPGYFTNPQ
jgi:hypothetical protein